VIAREVAARERGARNARGSRNVGTFLSLTLSLDEMCAAIGISKTTYYRNGAQHYAHLRAPDRGRFSTRKVTEYVDGRRG
jgi:hypothetical protein